MYSTAPDYDATFITVGEDGLHRTKQGLKLVTPLAQPIDEPI